MNDSQVITSRAVAVAAKALSVADGMTDTDWSAAPLQTRNGYYDRARAALEAAAPHIAAQAWDEGADEAWSVSSESFNGEYPDAGEPFTAVANPYRPAK